MKTWLCPIRPSQLKAQNFLPKNREPVKANKTSCRLHLFDQKTSCTLPCHSNEQMAKAKNNTGSHPRMKKPKFSILFLCMFFSCIFFFCLFISKVKQNEKIFFFFRCQKGMEKGNLQRKICLQTYIFIYLIYLRYQKCLWVFRDVFIECRPRT